MSFRQFTRRSILAGATGLWAMAQAPAARADALDNFSLSEGNPPVPDIAFTNRLGGMQKLSDYRGKVVLFNAWATWCGPCINEMPSLDKAQKELGGDDFQVVPVSMDRTGVLTVELFYRENNLRNLPILVEHQSSIARELRPRGLPFTLLIDRDGNELGRALGEVFWDQPEGLALLRRFI